MFKAEKQQENSIKFQVKIWAGKNFPNAQEPNEMSTLWTWAHYEHEHTIQPKGTLNECIQKRIMFFSIYSIKF